MRTTLWFGFVVACDLSLTLATTHAQQGRGYIPRVTVARPSLVDGAASRGSTARGEANLLRPYGTRASSTSPMRPYLSTPRPAAPSYEIRTHNYFPGLRPGQGPNQNTVNTDRLCVPGRRPFLMGGLGGMSSLGASRASAR
jgi:hypothetical protein